MHCRNGVFSRFRPDASSRRTALSRSPPTRLTTLLDKVAFCLTFPTEIAPSCRSLGLSDRTAGVRITCGVGYGDCCPPCTLNACS